MPVADSKLIATWQQKRLWIPALMMRCWCFSNSWRSTLTSAPQELQYFQLFRLIIPVMEHNEPDTNTSVCARFSCGRETSSITNVFGFRVRILRRHPFTGSQPGLSHLAAAKATLVVRHGESSWFLHINPLPLSSIPSSNQTSVKMSGVTTAGKNNTQPFPF